MRAVELPPNTRHNTREYVDVILRAFNRRSVRHWKSDNVTRDLVDYAHRTLHVQLERTTLNYTLVRLEKLGYVKRKVSESGHRTLSIIFPDDVDLTFDDHHSTSMSSSNGVTFTSPPVPFQLERPATYRLLELTTTLESWAEVDREVYASWVDAVINNLQEHLTRPKSKTP